MLFFQSNRLFGDGNEPVEYGTFTQTRDLSLDEESFTERRREIEKALLRKLDLRTAFLILVYVMNYVSGTLDSLNVPLCFVTLNHIPIKMDRNNAA